MADLTPSLALLVFLAVTDGLLGWFVLTHRRSEWAAFSRAAGTRLRGPVSLLSFRETRRVLRIRGNRVPAVFVGVTYAIASMLIGQMLELFPTANLAFFWVIIPYGRPSWDYPALLIAGPNEVIALPFLPTITMVAVSIGVAIGGGVAIATIREKIRNRRGADRGKTIVSATAGATSGITGLATLGACCCVSCATAGGVAVVAAASGASFSELLRNNWYIDLFQVVIVWFSLLIQERNLRSPEVSCPPPRDARTYTSAALRVGLLVAGITWSLAMFVEWSINSPLTASAATWYHWIFEHQLLSCLAVLAAIMPKDTVRAVVDRARTIPVRALRLCLAVSAVTWGLWVPVQLSSLGLGGFVNELLGYLGLPASWGSIAPDSALGAALLFHWAFQHLLLSVFALVVAFWPARSATPLLWGVERGTSGESRSVDDLPRPTAVDPSVPAMGAGLTTATPAPARRDFRSDLTTDRSEPRVPLPERPINPMPEGS